MKKETKSHKDCYFKKRTKGKITIAEWIWEAGHHGYKELTGFKVFTTKRQEK